MYPSWAMSVIELGAVRQVYTQDFGLNQDINTIHIEWFVVVACELDTSKDTKDNYYTEH